MSDARRAFLDRIKGLSHKQSLLLCWELQKRLDAQQGIETRGSRGASAEREPIAIVGLGCRFPGGGETPEAFWQSLMAGRESVREVPKDRWDLDLWYDPDPAKPERIATRRAGFLTAVDGFDADFFGLSPREALSMDPQQRLLLEVVWSALEHAHLPPRGLRGKSVGVFVGISTNDYADLLQRDQTAALDSYFLSGNALNFAAGRIAYTLGLEGPSLAVDTACSSSLVALHLAAQAIKLGDCELALVGGVNLLLSPFSTLVASRARMLSPSGRCRAFDAGADGMVRGEGCGVVVLKSLAAAQRDGNRIWAVLQGSAVNQDGASSGITVPNRRAQEAVVRAAQARAGVTPADVGVVEAHGTGTPLGDPIEAHGLGAVFHGCGERFLLGSVKTNLGHLESAAGMAGVIKTVLALNAGQVPPHLHVDQPNPAIQWDQVPADLALSATAFPARRKGRVAGVSSFGGSGTNAHAVLSLPDAMLDTPPAAAAHPPSQVTQSQIPQSGSPQSGSPQSGVPHSQIYLLPLSARSTAALATLQARTRAVLAGETDCAGLARTAMLGRDHFPLRRAVVGGDRLELADGLTRVPPSAGRLKSNTAPVFLFSGQGGQYLGMGAGLYAQEAVFKQAFDDLAAQLDPALPCRLADLLFADKSETAARLLNRTDVTQPALYALQLALVALWRSWGITPSAVAGHSLGAFAAAVVAGVMTAQDGAQLVLARGKLVEDLCPEGRMLALSEGAAAVARRLAELSSGLAERLAVSACNAPDETVVTGDPDAIEAFQACLRTQGVRSKRLTGRYGFHSSLVEPALDPFCAALEKVSLTAPRLPFICTEAGRQVDDAVTRVDYWRRQLRAPVNFLGAVDCLLAQGQERFVEIGPGATLAALVRRRTVGRELLVLPGLRKGRADDLCLRQALAGLYESGLDLAWHRLAPEGAASDRLPGYPFQRQRFWPQGGPPRPKDLTARAAAAPAAPAQPYHFTWLPLRLQPQPLAGDHPWVLLGRQSALSDALCRRLAAQGVAVRAYPTTAALLADKTRLAQPIAALLDLQPLDEPRLAEAPQWQAAAESASLTQLPALLRALEAGAPSAPFWLLTAGGAPLGRPTGAGGQCLPGTWKPDPLQALYWPFLRGAELERERGALGLLDLGDGWRAEAVDGLAAQILALVGGAGDERQVARSGADFLGLRLVPLAPLARAAGPAESNPPAFDPQGLYLVAGGAGGLGRQLCRWLVKRGAGHLLVLGRRNADPELESLLATLRAQGAVVDYLACRLGAPDCPALLAEALRDRPALRGIVHAAGTAVSRAADDLDLKAWRSLFRAKVAGVQQLDALARDRRPALFLLCSSAAASWGSRGLSAYGAVSGFLDALAERRQAEGLPGLSVAWGPWRDTGMNVSAAAQAFAAGGVDSLAPEAALAQLDDLLGGPTADAAQAAARGGAITVASVAWDRFVPLYEARRMRPLLSLLKEAATVPDRKDAAPAAPDPEPLRALLASSQSAQQQTLITFLQAAVAQVQGRSDSPLAPDADIADLGLDSLMVMDLLALCRQSYGIALYPKDFFEQSSLAGFAGLLARELRRLAGGATAPPPRPAAPPGAPPIIGPAKATPDALFLLSSPRSGSTLLRVMLAGHAGLFSPPELHLLGYESLKPWHAALHDNYLDEGLQRALMARFDLSADAAAERLAQWLAQDRPVADVYRALGRAGQLLVDKSPSYLTSPETLQRAERLFERPLYLHLVRHPLAVIDSFVRNRLERFMTGVDDPHAFAERHWRSQNENMEAFGATLPADRVHRMRYEDLVADPKAAMTGLMAFLDLPFDDRLLTPYEGQRMTDGPTRGSLQIGDPNFLNHQAIEPDLAAVWRTVVLPRPLAAETVALAQAYGYHLPGAPVESAAAPSTKSAAKSATKPAATPVAKDSAGARIARLAEALKRYQEDLQAHPLAVELRQRLRDQGLVPATWRRLGLGAWLGGQAGQPRLPEGTVTDGLAPTRAALLLPLRDADGNLRGVAPLPESGTLAPLAVPVGLNAARAALAQQGYGLILGAPFAWMKAQQAGISQALLGPLTGAGQAALGGRGTAFFDLSKAVGALEYIAPAAPAEDGTMQLKGRFEKRALASRVLGQSVSIALLLPKSAPTQRKLPLLLFLPGAEADLTARLAALPDQMMAEGDLPPLAIAWVQAPRSLYLDPPAGGPRWETFLVDELPDLLAQQSAGQISTAPFGVLGLSMGGLGALRMALRHPDKIKAASALAPALEAGLNFAELEESHPLCLLRPRDYLARFFGPGIDDAGQWQAHHPSALVAARAAALKQARPALQVICGEADSLAWDGSLFFHKQLTASEIDHDFQRLPQGRHDPAFFALTVPEGLAFVAKALSS